MMTGIVNDDLEALVRFAVLTLPPTLITTLGLS
jgi:hypothetical protein